MSPLGSGIRVGGTSGFRVLNFSFGFKHDILVSDDSTGWLLFFLLNKLVQFI
jgi:hypothetical protein